jgi:hypothetical protein
MPPPRDPCPSREESVMTTARRRPPVRVAPKKGPPVVPLAIGGGALLLIVVAVVLWKRGGDDAPPKEPANAAAATGDANGTAAAPPADANGAKPAVEAPPAPPPPPSFDRAGLDAKLAATTSAADALSLGDEALAKTQEQALADRCFARALALEPENAAAKRRLDVRAIDPDRDFPGLGDVRGTPQTYLLKSFIALDKKKLSRPERQAELARWEKERPLIEARVAESLDDPWMQRVDQTRNMIAQRPFFESFDYEVVENTRPYALFVELKGNSVTERDARRAAVEEAYAPYLAAFDRSIHDYLLPLSPKPPKDDPAFMIFILLDRGSYDRFLTEFEGMAGPPGMRAHYTPQEKWAFTYSPDVTNVRAPDFIEGTQTLLHEITHAWVDKLATGDDGRSYSIGNVQTHWFNEGIAEWMSCHFMDGDAVKFQPWKSLRMTELAQRQKGVRIPFRTAFRIGANAGLLTAAASETAAALKLEPGRALVALQSHFYADMWLWIFWLEYAEDGHNRKLFQDYARKELAGEGGTELADKIFEPLFEQGDLEAKVDAFREAVASGKLKLPDRELKAGQ